ncbi:MAG: LysE family transporter, partial [Parcubacteria group bacterium]|nr:LysE family transporter [Parcubacteria group bacterium]
MFILLQAALLGLVAGLTPGPMLTALLVNTLQGGARTGFRTLVWIMLWEILVTSSLILVATLLPLSPAVFGAIGIVGGIVLLYLAWQVFQVRGIQAHATGALFTPRKLLLLQATNPHLYVFWITIGLPLIFQMSQTWT